MNDPVYDPIAAFAAQLCAFGVRDIVISPGSRSTPLSLTFHARPEFRTWIQLDERSAAFFALGQARATGRPSVLICTSGTAAANYLPAVVEANHAGVPMIVCTADRPPELRGWGAGQTIDQVGIYGSNVRWFGDLPIPSDWSPDAASMAAMRAFQAATGDRPGPVHCNWPLREPLEPVGAVPVAPRPARRTIPDVVARSNSLPVLDGLVDYQRGVIIVGPDATTGLAREQQLANGIVDFARRVGWPVIAEPLTQVRSADGATGIVLDAADHLLKHSAVIDQMVPDVVVRIGASPTTKPVRLWLERVRPEHVVLIDPDDRWPDASFTTTEHHRVDPLSMFCSSEREAGANSESPWLHEWQRLNSAALDAIEAVVETDRLTSATVVRTLAQSLPADAVVMSSNSMPVRDLDSFVSNAAVSAFVGNRGASGIDGITSTGLGLASTVAGPVVVFTGDLALLHDVGALLGAARAGLHLTVVCVDNDGGAIFSMLPIAANCEPADFETVFRTPHGVDLTELEGIAGIQTHLVDNPDELRRVLSVVVDADRAGPVDVGPVDVGPVSIVIARVEPDADMAQRRSVRDAVGQAIGA